jgi:hypothetical protein
MRVPKKLSNPSADLRHQHHFLLSNQTIFEIFITNAAASAAALGLISKFLPRQPCERTISLEGQTNSSGSLPRSSLIVD